MWIETIFKISDFEILDTYNLAATWMMCSYIRSTSAHKNKYVHIDTDNTNVEKQRELLYGKSSKENTHCFCTQWVQSHNKNITSRSLTHQIFDKLTRPNKINKKGFSNQKILLKRPPSSTQSPHFYGNITAKRSSRRSTYNSYYFRRERVENRTYHI